MLRFLHIADLHLGMKITRYPRDASRKIQEARFQALERVRALANSPNPGYQFVVIAGDLFDDAAVDGPTARRAFSLLESFACPVLVLPGNHDPLQAGAVWDIDPWRRAQTSRVRVLRTREPFDLHPDVRVFPCPVFRKTSTENPTAWIRAHITDDKCYRIGIAHGSVMDRPNLPVDDHPIDLSAADDLELDYLALGHWHASKAFPDRHGHKRMHYTGVHEPMRFGDDLLGLGWKPYSSGGMRAEFQDDGEGTALGVEIERPGAVPTVTRHAVGHLNWKSLPFTLNSDDDLGRLIELIAGMEKPELTVLRLMLTGVLSAQGMLRLEELRDVLGRFLVHELDERQLRLEPAEADIDAAIGTGVLATVYGRLCERLETGNETEKQTARRAILLLYRLSNPS
jgi:DNA repair exonuclease SbcCD nuclease subunit